MKVYIFQLRKLIWGSTAFLGLFVISFFLLTNDPLEVAIPFKQETIPTSSTLENNELFDSPKPALTLDITVEGDKAHVKMLTQNFTFMNSQSSIDTENSPQHGTGYAHLYLDGTLIGKLYEPEFRLSKLPKGEHELKVELMYSNDLPYKVDFSKFIQVD